MPSGCVSLILVESLLLAHPFMHKAWKNVFSVFCGSVTPSDNPLFYLNAVKSIIEFYQNTPSIQDLNIPLVINTHGWIKSELFAA
jgi:polynucleotide 5'-kinase involved in rRNA processing